MKPKKLLLLSGAAYIGYTLLTQQIQDTGTDSEGGIDILSAALSFLPFLDNVIPEKVKPKTKPKAKAKGSAVAEKVAQESGEKAGKEIAGKLAKETASEVAEKVAVRVAEKIVVTKPGVVTEIGLKTVQAVETVVTVVAGAGGEKAGVEAGSEVSQAAEKQAEKSEGKAAAEATEKAESKSEGKAAAEATEKAEREATEKAEREATEKAEREAVEKAEREAVEKAEREASERAEREASKLARNVATKEKVMNALSKAEKGGIFDLMLAGIAITLQNTVKEFDESSYEDVEPGKWSYSQLPEGAKVGLSLIPYWGSIVDLVGPLFQFQAGCPDGYTNENGLCFKPCENNFKSDGGFICYKQYGDYWETKPFPAEPTITSVTKSVLTNTGVPTSECDSADDKQGGLCYDRCPPGYSGVGPLCWAETFGVGAGTEVELEDCPSGWSNDGLTCREPISCASGWEFFTRGCWGGNVVGRLNNGGKCPDGKEKVDGMCYNKCPEGQHHVPGMPYLCKQDGTEISIPRNAGRPLKCPPGLSEDSLGLCYADPPPGFVKTTLGLIEDICPAGTFDFGVGCSRESYTRDGVFPLLAELRRLRPE